MVSETEFFLAQCAKSCIGTDGYVETQQDNKLAQMFESDKDICKSVLLPQVSVHLMDFVCIESILAWADAS